MKKAILTTVILMLAGAALALAIGAPAPDFKVADWKGKEVKLSEHIGKQNVLLVFSRYIGCSYCQMFIIDLHNKREEIAATNTKVLIVNLSPKETLDKYSPPKDFSFDLIPDPERKLYELYGVKMEQGQVTGNVFWQSLRFLTYLGRYEYVDKGLEGAHAQPPAVFVIGKDGKVKAEHIGKDMADNPKVDMIVGELKKLPQ